MKILKCWFSSVIVVLLALVVPVGCDDGGSGDDGELDAYFDSHPYVSDPRDGGATVVTLTPPSATLSTVGEKAVFQFNGGSGPISWDVSDPSKGSISGSGDQGVYTVAVVGRNDVIAYDRNGNAAIAKISGSSSDSASPLGASAAPSQLDDDLDLAILTASGGTPPYSWEALYPAKGNLTGGSTGASVTYQRLSAGDNSVKLTDSLGTIVSILIAQP